MQLRVTSRSRSSYLWRNIYSSNTVFMVEGNRDNKDPKEARDQGRGERREQPRGMHGKEEEEEEERERRSGGGMVEDKGMKEIEMGK